MTEKLPYRLFRFIKEERNLILFSFFFLLILFFYNNYPFVKSSCPADECEANMMVILETPVLQTLSKIINCLVSMKIESFVFANSLNVLLWVIILFAVSCFASKIVYIFRKKKIQFGMPVVFLTLTAVSIFTIIFFNVVFRTPFSTYFLSKHVNNSKIYSMSICNSIKFGVIVKESDSAFNNFVFYYYNFTGWLLFSGFFTDLFCRVFIISQFKFFFPKQVLLRRDFVCRKDLLRIRWFFAVEFFHQLISKNIFTEQNYYSFPHGLVTLYLTLFEEIWFRSLIQNILKKFTGKIHVAIVLQALIFTVSHGHIYFSELAYSLTKILSAFFSGILYGYAKERYGLQWSWMLHLFYNILGNSF